EPAALAWPHLSAISATRDDTRSAQARNVIAKKADRQPPQVRLSHVGWRLLGRVREVEGCVVHVGAPIRCIGGTDNFIAVPRRREGPTEGAISTDVRHGCRTRTQRSPWIGR